MYRSDFQYLLRIVIWGSFARNCMSAFDQSDWSSLRQTGFPPYPPAGELRRHEIALTVSTFPSWVNKMHQRIIRLQGNLSDAIPFWANDLNRSFLLNAFLVQKGSTIVVFSYTIIYIAAFSCIYLVLSPRFTFHNVEISKNFLFLKMIWTCWFTWIDASMTGSLFIRVFTNIWDLNWLLFEMVFSEYFLWY